MIELRLNEVIRKSLTGMDSEKGQKPTNKIVNPAEYPHTTKQRDLGVGIEGSTNTS